jgi:hypothetical protein
LLVSTSRRRPGDGTIPKWVVMNRKTVLIGLGAVLAAALAGCGQPAASGTGTLSARPSTNAPGTAPSTAAPGNALQGTAGPGTPAGRQPGAGQATAGSGPGSVGGTGGGTGVGGGPAECSIGQLDVSIGGGDAGLGHRSRILVFRNTGSATCVLQGYPGVAALDGDAHQVAQARRTLSGYLGGTRAAKPPLVRLGAGAAASAMVEAVAFGANGASCAAYAGLLVTPPDETHSVRVNWGNDGCSDLQVHPVVPGTTGRSGP